MIKNPETALKPFPGFFVLGAVRKPNRIKRAVIPAKAAIHEIAGGPVPLLSHELQFACSS